MKRVLTKRKNRERRPLEGWRVVVTREKGDRELSPLLASAGAKVLRLPAIELQPVPGGGKRFLKAPERTHWIILSSKNGVDFFFERLHKAKVNRRRLEGVRFACIGRPTAEALRRYGFHSDLTPGEFSQEGLARAFGKIRLGGRQVLLARALEARDALPRTLRKRGAAVEIWNLYRTVRPKGSKKMAREIFERRGGADLVTFASSRAAGNFCGFFTPLQRKKHLRGLPVACIGPVTARAVEKLGFRVEVQPKEYTFPALVNAIIRWARSRKRLSQGDRII